MNPFKLSGNIGVENGWVGFGFSIDEQMGHDDLYFCQHHNGQASFKSAISYARAPPAMLPPTHVINPTAAYKRGVLQCRFDRKAAIEKAFRGTTATFDLAQDNFYLLVAWGTMDNMGRVNHHKMRTLTSKPIDFGYPPTANEIMSQKDGIMFAVPQGYVGSPETGYTYTDNSQSVMSQSYWAPANEQSPVGSVATQNQFQNQQQYNQYNQQDRGQYQYSGYSISEEEINRRFELYKDSPLFKAIRDATRGGRELIPLKVSKCISYFIHIIVCVSTFLILIFKFNRT